MASFLQRSNYLKRVAAGRSIMTVGFSVDLIGYLLSGKGAAKLVGGEMLSRCLPPDDYINVLAGKRDPCNRHMVDAWPEELRLNVRPDDVRRRFLFSLSGRRG